MEKKILFNGDIIFFISLVVLLLFIEYGNYLDFLYFIILIIYFFRFNYHRNL